MASQTDQRATDFEEVKKILAQHPRISLVQTEGEPPDCYHIAYHLIGLAKAEDGSIAKVSKHEVMITLPFGYPHFPPAVKPLTPVFHPNVDPDGVRISSRWQQEASLAKIIPYIGEMFCGKVYSLDEPFNQEAADWYASHAAELPLDALEGADMVADDFDLGLEDIDLTQTDSGEDEGGGISLELERPQPVQDIAALAASGTAPQHGGISLELETPQSSAAHEDIDLGVETFGAADDGLDLGLEIGEPEEVAAPPEDFSAKIAEIRSHVERREMTIAGRLLAELPAALPEAEPLRKKVKAAQAQCDQLLQEMKVMEDEDNFPEAQKIFEKLKKVAVDTPGLADIGRRLQQSQSMLDTFSIEKKAEEPEEELPPPGGEKKKKAAPPAPPKQKEEKKEKPAAAPPTQEKKEVVTTKTRIARSALHREIPVMPFAVAAVAAALIIAGGVIYTRDSTVLLEAELNWQETQQLVRQKKFKEAEDKANAALAKLKTVILPLPGKSSLRKEIDTLLAAEEVTKGRDGQGKYKDKYLPIEEVSKREQLDKLTVPADQLEKEGKLGEAAAKYEKAAELAGASPLPLLGEAEQFKEKTRQLRLQEALGTAGKADQAGDYDEAARWYQKALQFCVSDCDSIRRKAFNAELKQAKNKFQDAPHRFQNLLEQLKQYKEQLEKNPETVTAEKRQELESLLTQSQFYQLLSQANEKYSKDAYSDAVTFYRQAAALLQEKRGFFKEDELRMGEKISRTAAMIEISSGLNDAADAEQRNNLSGALRRYREVQQLIRTLGTFNDNGLASLANDIDKKIEALSGAEQQNRKTEENARKNDWLKRNYKSIFLKAYPQTRAELLSSPSFQLLKKMNNQELYKLNCTERSYIQLEVCCYLYNPASDQWTACPDCQ